MTFKELKSDYTIFVFDRTNMICEECNVVSVSTPRFENKVGATPSMMVDVTIERNNTQNTFVFPSDASKAYNSNNVFAIDKQDVINDIRAIKRASEQILADVDKHKDIVANTEKLLADLDTTEKERMQNEQRFGKIENSIQNLTDMFGAFMKEWKGQ